MAVSDIGTARPALLLAQGGPCCQGRLKPPATDRQWAHMPECQEEGTKAKQQGPERKCFNPAGRRSATHSHTGLRCRAKAAMDDSALNSLMTCVGPSLGWYLFCGFLC